MRALPTRWARKPLSDFITLQRGMDLPTRKRRLGPYKVLSSGTLSGSHDEGPVKGPGFVVGRATNIGRPTWTDDDYWPLNTVLYAKDFMGNNPKFAYYWFLAIDLSAYNSGSVQPMLNRNYIASVPVNLPPIEEQRAIAATLGALDDKIESNRRVIDNSRELMRAFWDRSSKTQVVASSILKPVLGGTPKRTELEYWSGPIPWASAKDIASADGGYVLNTAESVTEAGIDNSAAKVLPQGTIVMTARGTVGALAQLSKPMAFNQSCYGLVSETTSPAVLMVALQAAVSRIQDAGHGSVFNTVNMATFDQIALDLPEDERVDVQLTQLSALILQHLQESARLTALRDTLLPELLSGRIRVPEASEAVDEAVGRD